MSKNWLCAVFLLSSMFSAYAQPTYKWMTSWTGSVQGPYPFGNPSAQPNMSLVFPKPESGAENQSFRMVVKPSIWSSKTRIRLSNALGTQPVTFSNVFVGLQSGGAEIVKGTNRPLLFSGKNTITVAPGESVWSDPTTLPFVSRIDPEYLFGKKLAISFYVPNASGPMTWHAKALQTSYVTLPGAGDVSKSEVEADFPFSTASWFFVDALDMFVPINTIGILAFGDSITDGTASTMNGDDRWPDVLNRRLRKVGGHQFAVVNAGIGGNQIAGPSDYSLTKPFLGGPSSVMRLERDVLSMSGINTVIWLEGINDFSKNGNASADFVIEKMTEGVKRLKKAGISVIGATVTTALGSSSAAHGFKEQDEKRKSLNQFIKSSPIFDGVIDFDAVIVDMKTGEMKPEFVPESTTGGAGDKLHPNRIGYQIMGNSIPLDLFLDAKNKK
ncbi:GDSL-type esterase/lipase family protein [Polynucleobacter kasalickyi]|uniref:Lysophospholipase L1 n=1 Tax=Polynucleobacter kasalickyi TaxID=1938817 RepID=A0A1W1Y3R6_9BURK|nr:GDSL-type esterase/lipase family protein [Polynucleobacter kasalickyi]SMC30802.1 Lysophospholipase L1 [Polynucleobacter kasalickyi]